MEIFVKFVIVLSISAVGLSEIINQTRHARKLLGIDWCSLNCGADKNIACEFNGMCDPPRKTCKFDAINKENVLHEHNKLRDKFASGKETHTSGLTVANMMALNWDDDLAFTAKCNLAKCGVMEHDKCRTTPKFSKFVGQNLLWYTWSETGFDCLSQTLKAITYEWYDEVKLVSASRTKEDGKKYEFYLPTAHFTQMIWATVTHIGCAVTKNEADGETKCLLACNYGPGGNMYGGSMFKEGKPCTDCPDGLKCGRVYKSLCGEVHGTGPAGRMAGTADLHPNMGLIIICLLFLHRYLASIK